MVVTNTVAPPPSLQSTIRSFFQPRTTDDAPQMPSLASTTVSAESSTQSSQHGAPSRDVLAARQVSLPKRASISSIRQPHINNLRQINALLLPVTYADSFYTRIVEPHPTFGDLSFSRVVLWCEDKAEPKVIGGIVCRIDPCADSSDRYELYIQSLALLSPYRSQGLASALLENVLQAVRHEQKNINITSIYAHVWTKNDEAIDWYSARNFKKEGNVINDYYRRLKPDSAWLLRRRITTSDLLATVPTASPSSSPSTIKGSTVKAMRPSPLMQTASFQDRRPNQEWNDLPDDILSPTGLLRAPSMVASGDASCGSSRSSSKSEKAGKKRRAYPAAAFGTPAST